MSHDKELRGRRVKWPTDERLLELAGEHGGYRPVARALGVHHSSLAEYLDKRGLREPFAERMEASVDDLDDVLTPVGRQNVRREAELKHLRKEKKRLENAVMEQEELVERIVSMASDAEPPPDYDVSYSEGPKMRDVIITLFDLQYGTKVRPTDTPAGMNIFNVEIFDARAERWVEKTINSLRDYAKSHTIDNVIIPLGGDLVEGLGIFKGQEWQLELDPVEQVIGLVPRLFVMIKKIVDFCYMELDANNCAIFGIPGNHGVIQKGALPATASWDNLVLEWLKDKFSEYPLGNFQIEESGNLFFRSQGHTFLMIHGDEVRGWGGIPYYGLTRFDAQALRMHNEWYDYLLLGHHHRPAHIEIGFGEHLMSGNWVGATQLSRKIVKAGRPSQWIYYVSEEYGVGERSKIFLQDPEEMKFRPHVHELSV